MVFDELRDYAPGDDAQQIEWKATARLGRPILKRMTEERDRPVALLVDTSPSLSTGYTEVSRADEVRRLAAALALAASHARDPIALALFSDRLGPVIPPRTGLRQFERALEILESPDGGAPTDLGVALAWASETLPRHSLVLALTDGFCAEPARELARCARRHELIVFRVSDPIDAPPAGLPPIRVRSVEGSRESLWFPGRNRRATVLCRSAVERRGGAWLELPPGPALIPRLRKFLLQRAARRAR